MKKKKVLYAKTSSSPIRRALRQLSIGQTVTIQVDGLAPVAAVFQGFDGNDIALFRVGAAIFRVDIDRINFIVT